MISETEDNGQIYKVVLNHEEQYSIWPVDKENALGWFDEGKQGSKDECLSHINNVWTDMRPKSLREAMERDEKERKTKAKTAKAAKPKKAKTAKKPAKAKAAKKTTKSGKAK